MASIEERRQREELVSGVEGVPFNRVLDSTLLPMARTWIAKLVEDPNLDPGERRGYIYALRALRAGLQGLYDQAGLVLPERIRKDLGLYERDG